MMAGRNAMLVPQASALSQDAMGTRARKSRTMRIDNIEIRQHFMPDEETRRMENKNRNMQLAVIGILIFA